MTTTATGWGSGSIVFDTGSLAQSNPIYLGNRRVGSAILIAYGSTVENGSYYLSANGGTNWELITRGNLYSFTNTGSDLRWKIINDNDIVITQLQIKYY